MCSPLYVTLVNTRVTQYQAKKKTLIKEIFNQMKVFIRLSICVIDGEQLVFWYGSYFEAMRFLWQR